MSELEPAGLSFELFANEPKLLDGQTWFTILIEGQIKQICVAEGTYDEKIFSSTDIWLPELLIELKKIQRWTSAHVNRDASSGRLCIEEAEMMPCESIKGLWHPEFIDLQDLVNPVAVTDRVFEATRSLTNHESDGSSSESTRVGRRIIVKVMRRPCDNYFLQKETDIYKDLTVATSTLTPRFLGHVVSRGQVIGFALEKIEGARAVSSLDDVACCRSALNRFHDLGFKHGSTIDAKCFLITGTGGTKKAYLISFSMTRNWAHDVAHLRANRKWDLRHIERLELMWKEKETGLERRNERDA